MIGLKFFRLTVIAFSHSTGKRRMWECRCDCGKDVVVATGDLNARRVKSCGCWHRDAARERLRKIATRHGGYKTREFAIWSNMINRCYNPKCACYPQYGGRGIIVCDVWRKSFSAFLKSMGNAPVGLTLDRIDNNGNYEPTNCRWATRRQQCNNYRRNVVITYDGRSQNATQWANELGLSPFLILERVKRGWIPPRLFLKPLNRGRKPNPPA